MKDAPAVEIEKKREIRFFLQPVKTGKSRCYSSILETSVGGLGKTLTLPLVLSVLIRQTQLKRGEIKEPAIAIPTI